MIEYTSKYAQGMQLMTKKTASKPNTHYIRSLKPKHTYRCLGGLTIIHFQQPFTKKNPIEGTFTTPLSIDTLQTHVKQQVSTKTGKLTIHFTPPHPICRYCIWYLSRFLGLPSGKRLHITMENHHAINGKIHYFDWVIFNSKLLVITRE